MLIETMFLIVSLLKYQMEEINIMNIGEKIKK